MGNDFDWNYYHFKHDNNINNDNHNNSIDNNNTLAASKGPKIIIKVIGGIIMIFITYFSTINTILLLRKLLDHRHYNNY